MGNFCVHCGSKLNEGEICACQRPTAQTSYYEAPNNQSQADTYQTSPTQYYDPQQNMYYNPQSTAQTNMKNPTSVLILSIISMACGIFGLSFFWCGGVFLFVSIGAVVTRNIARNKSVCGLGGMAKTGFITGIIGIVLNAIMFFVSMINA